jgi:competence ComEA-like helix-hairpin-helix protein
MIGTDLAPGFEYRVTIEGDHLRTLDTDTGGWGAALDGNFLRGQLPTGDGVEGGRFFSWFVLSDSNLLDVNLATAAELETVRGIGPELAGAIVALRTERGGFSAVDELIDISGIGPALLARIAPQFRAINN